MKKLFNFFKPVRLRDLIWNCFIMFFCVGIIGVGVASKYGAGGWQDTFYTFAFLYTADAALLFMLGYYLYNVISKFVKKR